LDVYSKFARTYPLKGKTAECVIECLEDLFEHYGVPGIIQSDNGKEFRNKLMFDLASKYKILLINGRPRRPQTQGQVERFNQTITRFFSKN
jgi:transposase InsO family protein